MEQGEAQTTARPTQDTYREKERGPTGPPRRSIGCEPTPRDDPVEVRLVVQGLPPGMEDREAPDVRAPMVRVACHGQAGLGHGLQEEVLDHPRVLERAWAEGMREGQPPMDT
jgi:hypothetical protein